MILFKNIMVNSRFCIETFCPCGRNEFYKIFITVFIFCKKNKVITLIIKTMNFIKTGSRCNIYFATDNRFDSFSFTCFIKVNTTMHNTMVSNSNCCLSEFFYMFYKRFYATCTVKDAVLGMYMQMCKINHNLLSLSVICVYSVFTKIMFIKKI